MKFLVTSDWHVEMHDMFSRPWNVLLTTRVQRTFQFMHWCFNLAKHKEVSGILHCGDLFSHKTHIPIPLFNGFYNRIDIAIQEYRIPFICIAGNHERYVRGDAEVNALWTMDKGINGFSLLSVTGNTTNISVGIQTAESNKLNEVISIYGVEGHLLKTIPPDQWPLFQNTDRKIVLLHEDILGSRYHTGHTSKKGINSGDILKWLRANNALAAFVGDIHRPQVLNVKNPLLMYVGAPYHTGFGDSGARGVWIVNIRPDGGIQRDFVEYTDGPQWITWDETKERMVPDLMPGFIADTPDFFKLLIKNRHILEWAIANLPSDRVLIESVADKVDHNPEGVAEIQIHDVEETAKNYAIENCPENLCPDLLVEKGIHLLKGVK